MPANNITSVLAIAVTTVHRTLIDLGAVMHRDAVEVALECALRRRITSIDRLLRRLEAIGASGRRGAGVLKGILEVRELGAPPTDSALEVRLSSCCDAVGCQFRSGSVLSGTTGASWRVWTSSTSSRES
jgi:hypothetical protein